MRRTDNKCVRCGMPYLPGHGPLRKTDTYLVSPDGNTPRRSDSRSSPELKLKLELKECYRKLEENRKRIHSATKVKAVSVRKASLKKKKKKKKTRKKK